MIRDGIRLRKRPDFSPEKYRGRILRLGRRLDALIATEPDDADARRLLKRLRRTGDHLFTFLDYPQIPFENNFTERQIRPAVVLRKNSQSNRSDRGATTQAVLMSVYRARACGATTRSKPSLRPCEPICKPDNSRRCPPQTLQAGELLRNARERRRPTRRERA